MAAEGKTVIFISHKLHEVMAVADRVTVLRGGETVATVDCGDATPRSLAPLMVGREVDAAAQAGTRDARTAMTSRSESRGSSATAIAAARP